MDVSLPSPTPATLHKQQQEAPTSRTASESAHSDGEGVSRNISGATVIFGDGAVVRSISFRSDFSAIQLSHVPLGIDSNQVVDFVASFGFEKASSACVRMRWMPDGSEQLAEVKVEDPSFAESFLRRAGHAPRMGGKVLAATRMQHAGAEVGSKRLQLSTVSCSWYKPSKVAWLHFDTESEALSSIRTLGRQTVHGRKLQVAYQKPPEHVYRSGNKVIHSVQLGNLHVDTTTEGLRQPLSGTKLKNIKWGPASYNTPNHTVERAMRLRLEEFGPLSDWEVINDDSFSNVLKRATARFVNAEDARTAASQLDGSKVAELGNGRIHVSAITSVKLSVQVSILRAVQADMDELKAQVWGTHHVRIKAYDVTPAAHKPHMTTLRIYGDNREAVAKAKGSVERMLAGTVATDGEGHCIKDAFFFKPEGATFLQEVMEEHSVFIQRDTKKSLLRIYGPPASTTAAAAALRNRTPDDDSPTTARTITLTPHSLGSALRGGRFKRLVETFGKHAVKIDIASTPKTVTFHGSAPDFEKARAILTDQEDHHRPEKDPLAAPSPSTSTTTTNDLCAICWTPPTDPIRRPSPPCTTHAYCRDCLTSQCAAGDIPIRCLGSNSNTSSDDDPPDGDAGSVENNNMTCNAPISLHDLSRALPAAAFDALLRRSFDAHVRARPDAFRFCPTPDCDRVYRCVSRGDDNDNEHENENDNDGRAAAVLLCDECFADVCTACGGVGHGGVSCAEARYLGSEGARAFDEWRRANDARPCPRCGIVIEKAYGCNHMRCSGGCGVHICWFCMEVFGSGEETYRHMGRAH
ncbi:rna recognition motif protein [Diplodia corticola]|uniref:RBR-type E3 ubiquitin transferase n=1 Tax=Diplodia corticola TaxID=236234 RepID=A0A1J9RW75_9PEZI|nr:rna recognition motif protein [Diplodia corticola]OJD32092.1 rna recognition motif protein [Diplodia corticola]